MSRCLVMVLVATLCAGCQYAQLNVRVDLYDEDPRAIVPMSPEVATRLIEDPALTDYVNEQRIALEICLTSNVQTRAAASYEAHPLRRYFDAGLNVVLNTDNRLMSGTTLTDEYAHAAEHLDFSFDELATIALNGFASAFLPADERDRLIESATADIAALKGAARV